MTTSLTTEPLFGIFGAVGGSASLGPRCGLRHNSGPLLHTTLVVVPFRTIAGYDSTNRAVLFGTVLDLFG